MKIWIDAQLSPAIAGWIASTFGVEATALRELGLRDATDLEIFWAARQASAVVVTKDSDFVDLVNLHGTPPQVLWLTCGNTSNAALKQILATAFSQAIVLLQTGEKVVEIRSG